MSTRHSKKTFKWSHAQRVRTGARVIGCLELDRAARHVDQTQKFWSLVDNNQAWSTDAILVDCVHDHRVYVDRNLVVAKFLQQITGMRIIALVGMPFRANAEQDLWIPRHLDLIRAHGIEQTIRLPDLAPEDAPPDAALASILSQLKGNPNEALPVDARWNIVNWTDDTGFPLGKFLADTFLRAERIPTLRATPSLTMWANQAARTLDWGREMVAKNAVKAFVTGHLDYMPWGILSEIVSEQDGRVVYQRTDGRANITVLPPYHRPSGGSSRAGLHAQLKHWEARAFANFSASIASQREAFNTAANAQCAKALNLRIGYDPRGNATPLGTPGTSADWRRELGVEGDQNLACLFAHTLTDVAACDDSPFVDYVDWMEQTVEMVSDTDDATLLIKRHPLHNQYDQTDTLAKLEEKWSRLPVRFFSDGPDRSSLAALCNLGLTVRGSPGIEMACHGMTMLLGGAAPYSNIGFTNPSASARDYQEKLVMGLKGGLLPPSRDLARLYYAFSSHWARPMSPFLVPFGQFHTDDGYWDRASEGLNWGRLEDDDVLASLSDAWTNGGGRAVSRKATNPPLEFKGLTSASAG